MRSSTSVRMVSFFVGVTTVVSMVSACTTAPPAAPAPTAQAQKPQAAAGNTILAAVPNAPKRPTATPAPAGFTPAPAPQPPAAQSVPIAFYVDTVTAGPGESQFNVDPSLNCVRDSSFKRGMHVVWRMKATDTAAGKEITRDGMEVATLKLPNGDTRNFSFGRHGANADSPWFWTAAWDIPMDYPLGIINYSIDATAKSGAKGTFKEIPVTTAQLQVIE